MQIVETFAPPSPQEMADRLHKVQGLLAETGLSAHVTADVDNILWLTNFANFVHERPFILVIPAQGALRFVVPRLELDHVEVRHVGALEVFSYAEYPAPPGHTWADRLADALPLAGRIGADSRLPTVYFNVLGGRGQLCDPVERAREVKSAYELGRIAYGCRLKSEAHDRLLREAHPGMGQAMINATIGREVMARMVADNPNVNPYAVKIMTLIQNADVSHDPHNFTDLDIRMKEGGPHVTVFNSVLNGYGAEVERTFFLNRVPEAARRPFETMLEARQIVIEGMRPGRTLAELDEAAAAHFRKAGYGDNIIHRAGHGMGVTAHEGPYIAQGDRTVIQPGMVFSVEPGIYLRGIGGFRFSDTVVVNGGGIQSLTWGPETLDALTLQGR